MSVMLTGVVIERLPRWATEEAGRGERLPRVTTAGRWLLYGVLFVPVAGLRLALAQQLDFALFPDVSDTPVLKWISGPVADRDDQRVHELVRRPRRHLHHRASRTTSPTG